MLHLTRSSSSCIHLPLSKLSSLRLIFILLSYLLLSVPTFFCQCNPVQLSAPGPRQHSLSWFRAPSGLNGVSSPTRGGVCLSEWAPHLLHRKCAFFRTHGPFLYVMRKVSVALHFSYVPIFFLHSIIILVICHSLQLRAHVSCSQNYCFCGLVFRGFANLTVFTYKNIRVRSHADEVKCLPH
jgi:hypothetical protein